MALREKSIEDEIAKLKRKIEIYEGIKAYFSFNNPLSFPEAAEISKLSSSKFIAMLREKDFPNRQDARNKGLTIEEDIEKYISTINKRIFSLREAITGSLDQLIIIPSWRKLLGTDFRGFYKTQSVNKIYYDSLILLSHIAVPVSDSVRGELSMLITGVGIYFTKFEITKGIAGKVSGVVTDFRPIDGFLLPLDLWSKAQSSDSMIIKPQSNEFESHGAFTYTENLIDIPFSLFTSKRTLQAYARGVLARNVFIPLKEAIDTFVKHCKETQARKMDNSLRLLLGGLSAAGEPIFQNEILIEKDEGSAYMDMIPGIKNIKMQLDRIAVDLELNIFRKELLEAQPSLKKDFVEVGYPNLKEWIPHE